MWIKFYIAVILCCLVVQFGNCKKAFLVIGPQTIPYKDVYKVAVASSGYDKPEIIEVKILGKLENGKIYEKLTNVTLQNDGIELLYFDLRDQSPGNYFIKVRNQTFVQSMRLNMNTKKFSVFIQTDKAIYKPGEKVQFRVLILNPETKPHMTKSVEIFITDAENNRIKQYDRLNFRRGVYKQDLQLSDQTVLGLWTIHVKVNGDESEATKQFEVAEYVLPKFEVTVSTKSKISKTEDIVVTVNAKYTYGKDVDGAAVVSAELIDSWWGESTQNVVKHLDNSTKTTSFSLKNDLNLQDITWIRTVLIKATFTELLTGKQQSGSAYVQVYNNPYTVEMDGSDDNIKPDIPFTARAIVKNINEVPVTDNKEQVECSISLQYDSYEPFDNRPGIDFIFFWRPPIYKTIQVTSYLQNGIAEIPVSVTANITNVNIECHYKGAVGYFWVGTVPSETNQYLEIKGPSTSLSPSKPVQLDILSNVRINGLKYVVFSKNKIVELGRLRGSNTKYKLILRSTKNMIPMAKIVVFYVAANGEIISDRKILNFDTELSNFINIKLSKEESRPSSLINISISTFPMSYTGILGVDQSVLLLKSGNDIDKNVVNEEMSQYMYPNQYNNDWEEMDTYNYYNDFSAVEAVVLTNANEEYRKPYPYPIFPMPENSAAGGTETPTMESTANFIASTTAPDRGPDQSIAVRKNFPETWLFDCIDNPRGNTTITRLVPDTITSWIITGFSLNFQHGLGLTKQPAKLNVFLPFFLYLDLPYSIKRGEIMAVKVVVFNYMNTDRPAVVTMYNDNQEYEFVENTVDSQKITKNVNTKANSGTSVRFMIRALKIGFITLKLEAISGNVGDRVEQKQLVEAEGIKRYINEAVLIDLRSQQTFSKSVDVILPQQVVPDSLKIEASFIGDILGPTIDNLDNLLQMPYGCGEQNMIYFVPDIIILDYLKVVNQTTPQLEAKAIQFLESGYQRQLTYKRFDGSYSAFGNSDNSGSTWLTAFVARSFNQASKYISVDPTAISQALSYLEGVQSGDGSFPEIGVVHHKPLQGGSASGTGLTAYVLITFLENKALTGSYQLVIDKAVNNILAHVSEIDDVYTMSIVSFALYLAGKKTEADSLVQKLDAKADNSMGMRHWEKTSNDYYITSLSIETSAYALLAYLEASRDTDGLLIAKWLVSQRNQFGGFSSTQDTVVGLMALAKMAAKIVTKNLNLQIDVKYEATTKSIIITPTNALVLQKIEIPSNVRNILLSAIGSGFALAQVSYQFNINEPKKVTNFVLNASVAENGNYGFILNVCVQLKDLKQSNMAVMEISAPSGYVFDAENQESIKNSASNIKRVDLTNGNTLAQIYFDYLEAELQCLSVVATRAFDVADQKPASIIVYDYYENDLRTEIFYTPSKVLLCDICDSAECSDSCK